MKENQRIAKLFEDIYDGHPWIDVTILGVLKNIPASKGSKKLSPQLNSIWQIVYHIICWRENVIKRLEGENKTTPIHNFFVEIKNTSEKEWKNLLKKLEKSQQEWIAFLKKIKEKDFEKIYSQNNLSYYEHIHGIIQHDAYHLGQIALLAKMA